MRLLSLELKAFGPFTDRVLDLSAGSEGLHVIYGANEAGKSSAMRALQALLYGIDERSEDDFVHRHADLRIGGRLRHQDGRELHCLRRKGRKQTLLDAAGEALDEDTALAPFLGGVTAECFATLFAFDQAELVRGGNAVLDLRGSVGSLLFSAALGKVDVQAVATQLAEEARAVYLPRGSKPRLNTLLEAVSEMRRRMLEASRSAQQWQDVQQHIEQLQASIAAAEASLLDDRQHGEARQEARRHETELRRLQQTMARLQTQQATLDAEQQRLVANGAPPEPTQLEALRRERQRLWLTLRTHIVAGGPWTMSEQSLLAAYERAVEAADACATALWQQAARVQRAADLQQRQRSLHDEQQEVQASIAALQAMQATLSSERAIAATVDDAQVRHLYRELGALEAELGRFDGESSAADLAQQLQCLLADVREEAQGYACSMLAGQLLQQAIERYRSQHQATLLHRASQFFAELTGGRFSALAVSERLAAQPTLIGQRSSGQEVGVEGLSSGTRDQLYLALRLAALEHYLAHRQPMPWVIDDLLVHFDDERAAATLAVLGKLASRTQILFFTHHRHLVRLAEQVQSPAGVWIHSL